MPLAGVGGLRSRRTRDFCPTLFILPNGLPVRSWNFNSTGPQDFLGVKHAVVVRNATNGLMIATHKPGPAGEK